MRDSSQSKTFELSDFLPFQMAVVSSRLFQTIMSDSGLQLPEWRIMMALPTNQPCSSNDLCILTAMDAARVSRAQRRLEDLDLIDVKQDRQDRRRLIVQLSDTGQREFDRLQTAARTVEANMLDTMTPSERASLQVTMSSLFSKL
ncbi:MULTISPECIES: MarR family winged helix-turn-helix transcriptional regulator [unclassified Roseobacter]|jgi:DNA-binding MarR family transcriptional regulator|uniref:MarR family winged helix-turn-helix transcriptional regulator n=2 Tax=Alphaproteobacteria TaxID=28211 RepID=UPI00119B4062|nr:MULTISPECIES: MarR family transcriptional regulator [unclassified Roseobacter]MBF9048380.1 MarR family transcriptional regulator [Rhodobacterales bacterium HKCCD4356]NNV10379.1 MarR family transcriptional regulator [Roseobacter sp. HKCCD7357]NNV36804.1 MarR family transcriptional regulator [Roseobacter sp. HKCCD9054]NNV49574.1 MarR family transcriptional regulator [Roseobacter sp. HKCCD9025]NNV82029.1 MarR family transcriptional regulator [Roseobacter sp. HKCCD6547]NNV87896.1 MarR family t